MLYLYFSFITLPFVSLLPCVLVVNPRLESYFCISQALLSGVIWPINHLSPSYYIIWTARWRFLQRIRACFFVIFRCILQHLISFGKFARNLDFPRISFSEVATLLEKIWAMWVATKLLLKSTITLGFWRTLTW